jgi:gamma-glutamyl:cysteine ligase YbdK (ATP-grasp superfamily)
MEADFIDPVAECRVPARTQLEALLTALAPHAYELGCHEELQAVRGLADDPGATDQLAVARGPRRLAGLVEALADAFTQSAPGFSRLETS